MRTRLVLLCTLLVLACGPRGPDEAATAASEPTGAATTLAETTPTSSSTTAVTGSGSTSSSTGSTSDSGDSCGFLCDDDGGCAGQPGKGLPTRCSACDPFAQDCPEGAKCTAWASDGGSVWNATRCVPVGDKLPGDPCTAEGGPTTGLDDCIAGAMCRDMNADNHGICVPLCTGTADAPTCAEPSDACAITHGGVLNLCLQACDPLGKMCLGGQLCLPKGEPFVCVSDPVEPAGKTNAPCELDEQCLEGRICLPVRAASSACDPQVSGCCQPLCPFPGGACPNPDQTCTQWYDPATLPADDPKLTIGVCERLP